MRKTEASQIAGVVVVAIGLAFAYSYGKHEANVATVRNNFIIVTAIAALAGFIAPNFVSGWWFATGPALVLAAFGLGWLMRKR